MVHMLRSTKNQWQKYTCRPYSLFSVPIPEDNAYLPLNKCPYFGEGFKMHEAHTSWVTLYSTKQFVLFSVDISVICHGVLLSNSEFHEDTSILLYHALCCVGGRHIFLACSPQETGIIVFPVLWSLSECSPSKLLKEIHPSCPYPTHDNRGKLQCTKEVLISRFVPCTWEWWKTFQLHKKEKLLVLSFLYLFRSTCCALSKIWG